jgi:hypothetical protein
MLRYTGCAAWQISEREERSWAGLGQEGKRWIFFLYTLCYFLFSGLKQFWLFANIVRLKHDFKDIKYTVAFSTYIRRSIYFVSRFSNI